MNAPIPGRTDPVEPLPARTVVLPCYNEFHRLPPTLRAVRAYLGGLEGNSEIVVVDDGSTDGTAEWVREQAAGDPLLRLVSYRPNRGKGYAVRSGILAARGRLVLFMDADGATPVAEADAFWPLLAEGRADVVIGSRRVRGARILEAQSLPRRLASAGCAGLVRLLLLRGIEDTQCGFKAFTAPAAADIFSRVTESSALFDLDVLLVAARRGWRVAEQPVQWRHDGDSRLTYNAGKSARVFRDLLRMKRRHRIFFPLRTKGPAGS